MVYHINLYIYVKLPLDFAYGIIVSLTSLKFVYGDGIPYIPIVMISHDQGVWNFECSVKFRLMQFC